MKNTLYFPGPLKSIAIQGWDYKLILRGLITRAYSMTFIWNNRLSITKFLKVALSYARHPPQSTVCLNPHKIRFSRTAMTVTKSQTLYRTYDVLAIVLSTDRQTHTHTHTHTQTCMNVWSCLILIITL